MAEKNNESVKLPLFYRFILKFPKLNVEGFSAKFQGFFWVIGLPIFLICYVFFNLVFLVYVSFPYNYAVVGTNGFFFAMLIFRILIERAINSANAAINDTQFWREVDEAVQDYLSVCRNLKTSKETEKNEKTEEQQ